MNTNQKLIQRARDALVATVAGGSDKPFRRSDVVKKMLESRRNRRFGSEWVAIREKAQQAVAEAMKEAAAAGTIVRSGRQHWERAASHTRKLLNGMSIKEASTPVRLEILTNAPTKWLFVDCETGEVWQGTHEGSLKRALVPTTIAIRKAIR